MKIAPLQIMTLLLCAGAAAAQVHNTDFVLTVQNGRIVTGRVEGGLPVTPRYVVTSTLGDTGIPGATFNPGFDSENGTFSAGTSVGLTIRRALRVWNGSAFVLITSSPPTTMQLTKNATTIQTPTSDPPAGGVGDSLLLGLANSVGRLHQHPAYQLVGPAPDGVYLLDLQVWMGDSTTGVSDPIAVIFGQNADPAQLDAAFQWADANFHTQEPGSCYPNCDASTAAPVLNVADFTCFLQRFAGADAYANCDGSTAVPALNVADFTCFLQKFAGGCP
jgi:hypothetical protein